MSFLKKLFSSSEAKQPRPNQDQVSDLPWQWSISTSESDCMKLFQNLRNSLPAIFDLVDQPERDPVFVLVDVGRDQHRMWKALISLLYKEKVYYSPETLTGQSPQLEVISGDRVYKAPSIGGKELKVGIYVVERNNLFTALTNIAKVPPPLLTQVLTACPPDMFTVAFFCDLSLGIKHVSRDAKIDKNVPL